MSRAVEAWKGASWPSRIESIVVALFLVLTLAKIPEKGWDSILIVVIGVAALIISRPIISIRPLRTAADAISYLLYALFFYYTAQEVVSGALFKSRSSFDSLAELTFRIFILVVFSYRTFEYRSIYKSLVQRIFRITSRSAVAAASSAKAVNEEWIKSGKLKAEAEAAAVKAGEAVTTARASIASAHEEWIKSGKLKEEIGTKAASAAAAAAEANDEWIRSGRLREIIASTSWPSLLLRNKFKAASAAVLLVALVFGFSSTRTDDQSADTRSSSYSQSAGSTGGNSNGGILGSNQETKYGSIVVKVEPQRLLGYEVSTNIRARGVNYFADLPASGSNGTSAQVYAPFDTYNIEVNYTEGVGSDRYTYSFNLTNIQHTCSSITQVSIGSGGYLNVRCW